MKGRIFRYGAWLLLAGCLYFFENGTSTRAALLLALLVPALPALRRLFFAPDIHGEIPAERPAAQPESEAGDVREYRPGDPLNRVHWKLSAKRGLLLVRPERPAPSGEAAAPCTHPMLARRGRRWLLCLPLFSFLLLLLIPSARLGAMALGNRLFAASEAVNRYIYQRFAVPEGQSVLLAAALLILALAGWIACVAASGSRALALITLAACAGGQIYFGLPLPGAVNIVLFALAGLALIRRPIGKKDAFSLTAAALAAAVIVLLIWPGVHAPTEAASERARDWLGRAAGQVSGAVQQVPAGELEARRTHDRALIPGGEAGQPAERFRLITREAAEIARPHWIDYLRIALLLLAAAAVMIVPFLPFLWLNARRKQRQALEHLLSGADLPLAVCAAIQQTAAWLDAAGLGMGNAPYRDWAEQLAGRLPADYLNRLRRGALLFEEAAYSDHPLTENHRQQALALMRETGDLLFARADRRGRLRLRLEGCARP